MDRKILAAAAKINVLSSWNKRSKRNHDPPCLPAAAAASASSIKKVMLPSALPSWPPGTGFASGRICLGDIEICEISDFEKVWSCFGDEKVDKGASFFKPVNIPQDFHSLGYHGQPNSMPHQGWVVAAKETMRSAEALSDFGCNKVSSEAPHSHLLSLAEEGIKVAENRSLPALAKPLKYNLVWNSTSWTGNQDRYAYFWWPQPPHGYKSTGYVITNTPQMPSVEEIRCVRADLTDLAETHGLIWRTDTSIPESQVNIWNLRPCYRGMHGRGVPIGTFYCGSSGIILNNNEVVCLKNLDFGLKEMPNLDQINMLIKHYGPTLFFHPDEIFMPSSVSWFFDNGAVLCEKGKGSVEPVHVNGSNLPPGGSNDGKYWLDLPSDNRAEWLKRGNLPSAEVYSHIKPSMGGTFTDIAMWVFFPFNGSGTAKVGVLNLALGKIGEHVCDWEHFTLRISNFTGELHSIYLSQHSGGQWVRASDMEFIVGNKAVIYCAKSGHAMFPRAGCHLQGDRRLGVGIRNDAARSRFSLDSSQKFQIVAAEYLQLLQANAMLLQPPWLDYMREWGPTVIYNAHNEIDKMLRLLPSPIRRPIEKLFKKLPNELSRQEGPTGPKAKDYWVGDERG